MVIRRNTPHPGAGLDPPRAIRFAPHVRGVVHAALVDPLPAGLEAMNPALATTALPGAAGRGRRCPRVPHRGGGRGPGTSTRTSATSAWRPSRPYFWEGVHRYDYVTRATTPGTFVVPPPKAEGMYRPETFGRGGTDRVIVEWPGPFAAAGGRVLRSGLPALLEEPALNRTVAALALAALATPPRRGAGGPRHGHPHPRRGPQPLEGHGHAGPPDRRDRPPPDRLAADEARPTSGRASQLAAWGLENAHLEPWGPSAAAGRSSGRRVHMVAPLSAPLIALPKAWTPGTDGAARGAVMRVKVESEADLEQYKGKLAGKILLLNDAPRRSRTPAKPISSGSPRRSWRELAQFDVTPSATPAARPRGARAGASGSRPCCGSSSRRRRRWPRWRRASDAGIVSVAARRLAARRARASACPRWSWPPSTTTGWCGSWTAGCPWSWRWT